MTKKTKQRIQLKSELPPTLTIQVNFRRESLGVDVELKQDMNLVEEAYFREAVSHSVEALVQQMKNKAMMPLTARDLLIQKIFKGYKAEE